MSKSNTQLLEELITLSLDEVKNDYKWRDGFGGWHQFLRSDKIGNVATSQALLLLNLCDEDFTHKKHPYNFLLKEQQKGTSILTNGGWTYITNLSDRANTESTCWALRALLLEKEKFDSEINAGIEWLKLNVNESPSRFGWGCIKESPFRLYSTCAALDVLKQVSEENTLIYNNALTTVKRAQNGDGGWGDGYQSPSTLIHTSIAVITMLNAGLQPTSSHVSEGVKWIVRTLQTEGYERDILMGYVEIIDLSYTVDADFKNQRITFYHMSITYALMALIKAEVTNSEIIYQGVLTMMNTENHGRWQHPYLPNQYTLWAIYDVISLFKTFQDSIYYANFDASRLKHNTTIRKKYDVIIFTIVPVEFNTLNSVWKFAPKNKEEDFNNKGFWYYEYDLPYENEAKKLSCLITMVGSAGDVDCSIACQTAFSSFNCHLAVLCGIAAGYKEDVNIYDTVVSDAVVAYEFQRWESEGKTFRPKIHSVSSKTNRFNQKIQQFHEVWSGQFQKNLESAQLDTNSLSNFDSNKSKAKSGTIASGAKLLADGSTIQELRDSIPNQKGIIAVEMEGNGFASACSDAEINWIVFRGISDYGEDDKNNPLNKKFQPLAVISAITTMEIYLQHIYNFEE